DPERPARRPLRARGRPRARGRQGEPARLSPWHAPGVRCRFVHPAPIADNAHRGQGELSMGGIDVERDDRGVATVWLDNRGHLNALSDAMIVGLCDALPRLGDDASCRAIVLRGRGGVYCAGRELNDVKALQGAGRDAVERIYGAMAAMNEAVYY